MDVRALLFGSTLRVAATVLGGLVVVAGGAVLAGVVGVPSVTSMDNDFGQVNESVTPVHTDLVVHNPNPIGVSLGDVTVDYSVEMNDVTMATGNKSGIAIGTGNSTVNLTTYMRNERIPDWWVSHIRNGEKTTLVVNADVHSGLLGRTVHYQTAPRTISTDIISQFNSTEDRPVNADLAAVSDPLFWINETSATWGSASAAETPIDMEFLVYNPKNGPLAVSSIGYNITMNGVAMGSGELEKSVVVPPHSSKVVEARTVIENANLDEWWVSHLRNDQVTDLRIDFYAVVEPPGAGVGEVRVPLRDLTYTKTIETSIFQDAGESADGGSTDDGSNTNATTTDDTTTTSDDTTTTGGDTTTTDDGGLVDDGTTTSETTTTDDTTTDDEATTTEDGGVLSVGRADAFPADPAGA